ncbi:VIN3-like protein 2 [Selaginella moellendorffii]|uniref:VIN3-like protein 2 n=1 Tax=Selaginella moellendorffii TaxID=88036 RepID=UPI000D1C8551|nr:VIN3-like protein 2 [Selaginella moellendorffii]|eukprot:XP_002975321.2 VIN3-like protein 2 [Selaginella moellendorffii]
MRCANPSCRAVLHQAGGFCKRCSCWICRKYDDNKDPSLWFVCGDGDGVVVASCALSCHIQCVLKSSSDAIVDASYRCLSCGAITGLLGTLQKQFLRAKEARRVDVLYERLTIATKLVSGSEKYRHCGENAQSALDKLLLDIGPFSARGLVSRLSSATVILDSIRQALESLDVFDVKPRLPEPPVFQFEFMEVSMNSVLLAVIQKTPGSSGESILGFKLWHRKNRGTYRSVPTTTISVLQKALVTDLKPGTGYMFKAVAFSAKGDEGFCESRCYTKQKEEACADPLMNCGMSSGQIAKEGAVLLNPKAEVVDDQAHVQETCSIKCMESCKPETLLPETQTALETGISACSEEKASATSSASGVVDANCPSTAAEPASLPSMNVKHTAQQENLIDCAQRKDDVPFQTVTTTAPEDSVYREVPSTTGLEAAPGVQPVRLQFHNLMKISEAVRMATPKNSTTARNSSAISDVPNTTAKNLTSKLETPSSDSGVVDAELNCPSTVAEPASSPSMDVKHTAQHENLIDSAQRKDDVPLQTVTTALQDSVVPSTGLEAASGVQPVSLQFNNLMRISEAVRMATPKNSSLGLETTAKNSITNTTAKNLSTDLDLETRGRDSETETTNLTCSTTAAKNSSASSQTCKSKSAVEHPFVTGPRNADDDSASKKRKADEPAAAKIVHAGDRDNTSYKSAWRWTDKIFEHCVKMVRWLECQGHIKPEFRMRFFTWLGLKASDQQRRVVSIYIQSMIDDPVGLAAQLMDAFEEAIAISRNC